MITGEKTKKKKKSERSEKEERKILSRVYVGSQSIQMKGLTNIEYQVRTSEREHHRDDPSAWRARCPSLAENNVTKFPCKLSRVLFAILRTPAISSRFLRDFYTLRQRRVTRGCSLLGGCNSNEGACVRANLRKTDPSKTRSKVDED
ncbi:hypothetical protein K0M31_008569 [Melipona bicolor]|uniref:Uncharacterized protein n=1 Tax=Melipona bicolor TaxID=60889 RepID=A0AA40FQD4_9HYME|nr:hypothetical protein K0M31_008569 [Melipona bicolor]